MGNKRWLALAAFFSLACAIASTTAKPYTSVWVRSHNESDVDVYVLCGDRDATWLGVVPSKEAAAFEIPAAAQTRCPRGVNFFLVVRTHGRGYWAGPVRPRPGTNVLLVIEKYAGLSTAQLRNE
jgi:hypothetical protein